MSEHLKPVPTLPKPEGFELRDRRSDKTYNAADWTAQDALYDANQEVNARGCKQLIAVWLDDSGELRWRIAGSGWPRIAFMLQQMLSDVYRNHRIKL